MSKHSFSTLYGSKWVATMHILRKTTRICEFQYPLRVEVGCNPCPPPRSSARRGFQYPLRVEVGCNTKIHSYTPTNTIVSVPSTGRSGLQQWLNAHIECLFWRFSTLYGSKWVATPHNPDTRCHFAFQYPLRVEVGCNIARTLESVADYEFQYPLRVEVGCNGTPISFGGTPKSFSTLYGSKWVAT